MIYLLVYIAIIVTTCLYYIIRGGRKAEWDDKKREKREKHHTEMEQRRHLQEPIPLHLHQYKSFVIKTERLEGGIWEYSVHSNNMLNTAFFGYSLKPDERSEDQLLGDIEGEIREYMENQNKE